MQYQGITGITYITGDNRIARGGEGSIYPIQNQNTMVVKIFKPEKRTANREEKLKAMVKTKLSTTDLDQVVWPLDVVYEQGAFVGYVMPKLNNTDSLITLYSSGTVGKYDLRHRLLTAINLCYAIQTVHHMGQVCGDLNPQNICVNLDEKDTSRNFHVTLVDTDSYHYTAEGKTYRCEVGLSEYLAPELQEKLSGGLSLRDIPLPTYTKETDLFALAVHIFTLLMNGCHPFACARKVKNPRENSIEQRTGTSSGTMRQMDPYFLKNSVAAPQPNENMKNGFFPFYQQREGLTIPVYAPDFDTLPDSLRILFVRTFVDGFKDPTKRADSGEWIAALKSTIEEKLVIRCLDNAQHYYFAHRVGCPLCEVEQRIRMMLKPPIPNPQPAPLPISDDVMQHPISGNSQNTITQKKKRSILDAITIGQVIMIAIVSIFCVCVIGIAVAMDEGWRPFSRDTVYACPEVYTADGVEVAGQEYRILLKENDYPTESDYDYMLSLYDYGGGTDIPTGTYYASLYLLDGDGNLSLICDITELVDIDDGDIGVWNEEYYITITLPEGVNITS